MNGSRVSPPSTLHLWDSCFSLFFYSLLFFFFYCLLFSSSSLPSLITSTPLFPFLLPALVSSPLFSSLFSSPLFFYPIFYYTLFLSCAILYTTLLHSELMLGYFVSTFHQTCSFYPVSFVAEICSTGRSCKLPETCGLLLIHHHCC